MGTDGRGEVGGGPGLRGACRTPGSEDSSSWGHAHWMDVQCQSGLTQCEDSVPASKRPWVQIILLPRACCFLALSLSFPLCKVRVAIAPAS
jgi:hypothetical protein